MPNLKDIASLGVSLIIIPTTPVLIVNMVRNLRNTFFYVLLSLLFFVASLYHHYLHPPFLSLSSATAAFTPAQHLRLNRLLPPPLPTNTNLSPPINHQFDNNNHVLSTVSILLPAWEVLVIVSPDDTTLYIGNYGGAEYSCFYPNGDISHAKPSGILKSPDRATFKCFLPKRSRRKLPFPQPTLIVNQKLPPPRISPAPELLRWSHIVYDSLTTDEDVVLFAKGLNPRQGLNRDPSEFRCVFYLDDDVANGVRTDVTSSMQEVFRCRRPELTALPSSSSYGGGGREDLIKVTLETVQDHVVPTLAYFSPEHKLAEKDSKSLLCACTMVYNVAKFLKEWVAYHSSIGIQKFILYDNESDDGLEETVRELNDQGYDIKTYFWLWPKTQEAGFSHSAVFFKDSCTWMAYIDVDEFIYSPSWFTYPTPSKSMLHSLISKRTTSSELILGQISIGCYEFGPSNQTVHPVNGVTQGYDCRRKYENRHKSIVLMEAIDDSLLTAIHHFSLKPRYKTKKVGTRKIVVNHYKYQAWPEFKAKFRRRVSAYVVDWTDQVNPHSNDRTPGLGYSPVEPLGWPEKFCEVRDYGLKDLTRKWFGQVQPPDGYKMSWQR